MKFGEIEQNVAIFTKFHHFCEKGRPGPKWLPNTYENDKEYLVFWHRAPSASRFHENAKES